MRDAIQTGTLVLVAWLLIAALFRGDAVVQAGLSVALATGGLLWESVSPWMPPDLRPALLNSAVTLVGSATVAIMISMRSDDRWRAWVALLGAAAVTGALLRYDVGEHRSSLIMAAAVLAVVAAGVAVHIPLVRYVLHREEAQAARSVHALWTTAMMWTLLLAVGVVALWQQTMPGWAMVLLVTASTAAGIAASTIGYTIGLMWRHPGFAGAYAVPMSQTRIDVRGALLGGVLLLSPSVALPGIARALGGDPEWVSVLSWMSGAVVVAGVSNVMRAIRREALRQRRNALAGPGSAAVRDRALEEPVYRLLPGLGGDRD
ncbi:hypothetical protein C6361_07700 [Plantactinospora sp. BC1]|uniref:hypothetical protein n=1 Tax=Plantactinospora sp. BC1 TaxID=2108470 RepID=UPI000D15C3C5|nr:hypothetical protein [Plantactinospora sp. BC1]AVT29394.1 hypothetical protein C6361_07700 [Plantactinospora sp. BC1]